MDLKIIDVAKKFNRKVNRWLKTDIAIFQPEKINIRELRKDIKTWSKSQYRRELNKLKRYLERGSQNPYTTKEGVNITVWEKKEIDRQYKRLNQVRKKEMQKFQPSEYTGTLSNLKRNQFAPRKNQIQSILPKDWEKFKKNLEREYNRSYGRERIYKDNFLKAISHTIGEQSELYRKIKSISSNKLWRYFFTSPILSISFLSDPREAQEIEDIMLNELEHENIFG